MRLWTSAALALGPLLFPAHAAAGAYVRVDQLGDPAGGPSATVFVASEAGLAGETVQLTQPDGSVAASVQLAGSGRRWSRRLAHVYRVEVGPLARAGTYTVTLRGRVSAGARLAVLARGTLYGAALSRALSFYENQRDGPEFIPSPLRSAPAHLNDAHARVYVTPQTNRNGEFAGELEQTGETVNAAGGWWDAGDYLKFVETASYTEDVMSAADLLFPSLPEGPGPKSFAAESEFGLRWLARMWNASSATLYYQVGIGAGNAKTVSDHDIWRLPQEDDSFGGEAAESRFIRQRPVFRAAAAGSPVSPNLAGRLAAAFADGYMRLRQSEPALADTYLADAEQIYALADMNPTGHLLTAIPWNFYPETEWRDDMLLGAGVLARALAVAPPPPSAPIKDPATYTALAQSWLASYKAHSGSGEALNLYDTSALGEFELVRALRDGAPAAGGLEREALEALQAKLEAAAALAARDPFGLGTTWASADTTARADGLSATASMYDALSAGGRYAASALEWLGASLGANAWGSSFIVGDGEVFPHCLQHQVANLAGSLEGTEPVLEGAVVEGPSDERSGGELEGMRACPQSGGDPFAPFNGSRSRYEDNAGAYTNTEPAIDLTASSILAFAFLSGRQPQLAG